MCEWLEAQTANGILCFNRGLLQFLAGLSFKPLQHDSVRHIVVYRVGNIGDTVVAIPALTAIRQAFPEAAVTILTSSGIKELPGAAMVLEAFPGLVSRIVSYLPQEAKSSHGLKRLRANVMESGPVDLFIDLPVSLQTLRRGLQELFLARVLNTHSAFGFELALPSVFRPAYSRRFPERIPKTVDWLESIVRRNLGITAETTPLAFFRPDNSLDWPVLGVNPERPILAVNAGAKLDIKRWQPEAFSATIREIMENLPGTQVVLLGNAGEKALNDEIANGMNGVVNLAGKLTLSQTWALLSQATAVLSNDTGTMHMAGLLNKPVYTPMSGQYPAPLWHPPGQDFIPFREHVTCSPCFKDACPFPDQPCLKGIAPSSVIPALLSKIGSHKGLSSTKD